MLILVKLAWRNLFRNKRRTTIAGLAIGLGLAALILTDAIITGMERNMIGAATGSFLGEGQIHRNGFRETHDIEKTIIDPDRLMANLGKEIIVRDFSPRVISIGMISSAANFSSVSIIGIDPSLDKNLTQVDEAIIEGSYFKSGGGRELIIGGTLAETLETGIGDRIVLTGSTPAGELSQELFRISGIFQLGIREIDQAAVFIRIEKAQSLLGLGGRIHEIAVKFENPEHGRKRDISFWNRYSRGGNTAEGWNDLLPELEAAFDLSEFSIYITGIILFGVVALGIINTLFMSLHERMFEFGILRAVGTRPYRVSLLIMFESASLAVLSIILGMILGFIITMILDKTGIDYRGIELGGVTIREMLYPVLHTKQFFVYPLAVFLFTTVISLYPALYAARLIPAEALRKSL